MSKKRSTKSKKQALKPEVEETTEEVKKDAFDDKKDAFPLDRHSAIPEIQAVVRSTIGERKLATVDKKDEVKLIRAWCAKMGKALDYLDLRVTEANCAGGYGIIFVSEFRLVDPSTKRIPDDLAKRIEELTSTDPKLYSEFLNCNLTQRTFTLHAKNKGKSSYGDLIVLDYLKFWVKKFEILKRININYREFKWAPIVFVAASPGQTARLRREGLTARDTRRFPDGVDVALVKSSYDLTHTDRTLTQLELVVKELDKEKVSDEQKEEQMRDDLMEEVSQLLLDGTVAAKAKLKRPNSVFRFFDRNAARIVKYVVILFIVFLLVSVIIAFITNTPLFDYLPDVGAGGGGGGGSSGEVITEP